MMVYLPLMFNEISFAVLQVASYVLVAPKRRFSSIPSIEFRG